MMILAPALALLTFALPAAAAEEGSGGTLTDRSGKGHRGTIQGAAWAASPRGPALAFNRPGNHVDCGADLGRRLTADMTLIAWVRAAPAAYPDASTNWTIADCEDYTRSGFIVRVDGQTAKLYYRASAAGRTPDGFSRAAILKDVWHQVAVSRAGNRVTLFVDGLPDTAFTAERPAPPSRPLTISSPGQSFQGSIAALDFYDRGLSRDEVLRRYKSEAASYGKDASWFGKFRLEPFFYLDRKTATVEVDFGRAMLQSVDVMMDEIGADGPFMDGFMWAYGGEHTYDRWDGHTAQIDPKTKTIVRTMGSVLLLSQDALVAFCRKVRAKGGVVIANNSVITRTIGRESYLLHDRECFAGPEVHLAPTPLALSLPSAIRKEADIHRDVLDKLAWGNLYVYYEEGRVTRPSVPALMYPITFEEIRPGWVKGAQRVIASRSGVYGWQGDRDLHAVSLFDSRGTEIPHPFFTTADPAGARTRVDVSEGQCAVVRSMPVRIESAGPVNLRVIEYGSNGCELVASGRGPAVLTLRTGDFPVRPAARYAFSKNGAKAHGAADASGLLSFSFELTGEARIRVAPQ